MGRTACIDGKGNGNYLGGMKVSLEDNNQLNLLLTGAGNTTSVS